MSQIILSETSLHVALVPCIPVDRIELNYWDGHMNKYLSLTL